jgi:predicted DNA-binding transcriptional regulator AlpA
MPSKDVLVGVAEIAEMLGVSKTRADQLTRTREFPLPVERVIPVDEITRQALVALFDQRDSSRFTAETAWRVFKDRAQRVPEYPRLYRASEIIAWAESGGRQVDKSAPATFDGKST